MGRVQVPNDSQASNDKKTVELYYEPAPRFASVYLLPDDGDILTPGNFQLVGTLLLARARIQLSAPLTDAQHIHRSGCEHCDQGW